MLNNTNVIRLGSNSQTVNFNAPCTGILQRSHPKSKFLKLDSRSSLAKIIFPEDGSPSKISIQLHRDIDYAEKKEITVLQILILGEHFLIEYVFNTDLIEEIKE